MGKKSDMLLERARNDKRDHDMKEYFAILQTLAAECPHIVELGVRKGMSTAALLNGLCMNPDDDRSMISVDLEDFCFKEEFMEAAREDGINWAFMQTDSRSLSFKDGAIDLLFVDTLHNYNTADMELYLHGDKVTKYIVFHDTNLDTTYFPPGNDDVVGYWVAILKFLTKNPEWHIVEERKDTRWGLTILRRDRNGRK